jgi:large subunit ribosomal protein L19
LSKEILIIEKNEIKSNIKFKPGDTIRIYFKIKEEEKERIQAFEGVCIALKHASNRSSVTIRKISFSEGVEKIFPLFSPKIEKIKLIQLGKVRRSKLYYLRKLKGKKARIKEKKHINKIKTIRQYKKKKNKKIKEKKKNKIQKKK